MPLGQWTLKWNQARYNHSTYGEELVAGILLLFSQSRLLGSSGIVWLCDQEPLKSCQKGPPPKKGKVKRWPTYLSQFRLTLHHIPDVKNELSDYISRSNFDAPSLLARALILLTERFSNAWTSSQTCLCVRLESSGAGIYSTISWKFKNTLHTLGTAFWPRVIDGRQGYHNNQYLFYEIGIVVPEARPDGWLQWCHLSSGHTGANRSVDFLRECFYSSLTMTEVRSRMQTIVDARGCHASKQSNSRDRGLIPSLPIPYCATSLLYVGFIHSLPNFGGYKSCLVVTCGLSRFTPVFPCSKNITGEQTVKMLIEQ